MIDSNHNIPALDELMSMTKMDQIRHLATLNTYLETLNAVQRIDWAMEHLPGNHIVSSSFGIQAAVMLHLLCDAKADIPVILTDTGYLFPETYRFIDHLTETLNLNLKVYKGKHSPAWQEARYGRLWEQGLDGLNRYNYINKVEPMHRALAELQVGTWFSGLRREQSQSRSNLPILSVQHGVFKFLPLIEWTNKDIHYYLKENNLPYHPLWEEGYLSVGDIHTTRKWEPGMKEEETRFFGLKRECGLHQDTDEYDGSGI